MRFWTTKDKEVLKKLLNLYLKDKITKDDITEVFKCSWGAIICCCKRNNLKYKKDHNYDEKILKQLFKKIKG